MSILCRKCYKEWCNNQDDITRCTRCTSSQLLKHSELNSLSIAHIDCDAFYASIEKRDNPNLGDRPVLVGGHRRGVVMAACYVARHYGCRSAMPMFQALKACPHAVVIKPDIKKYTAVGREIRKLLTETTPLVEPLSIDEAFLDLSGTERLHRGSPARTLVQLVNTIKDVVGISVSVGLSYNKFLSKVASDIEKPRGFTIIGREEALTFLENRPVSTIWGVGKSLEKKVNRDGINTIGQLRILDEKELILRYGVIGRRLYQFSHGQDNRPVVPYTKAKTISAETTFVDDSCDPIALAKYLWPLCEKVSSRLKNDKLVGTRITLKLRTQNFRLVTSSQTLITPTQLADTIFDVGRRLLNGKADGTNFRLIGILVGNLTNSNNTDTIDYLDPTANKRAAVERAIDNVRAKLGNDAITKGRSL